MAGKEWSGRTYGLRHSNDDLGGFYKSITTLYAETATVPDLPEAVAVIFVTGDPANFYCNYAG